MLHRRVALAAAGALLFGGGAWLATGPLRLTVLNTALRLHHTWPQAAAALVAAVGAGLVTVLVRRRAARLVIALFASAAVVAAAHLSVYRIELTDDALVSEGLLRRSVIPWDAIGRVEVAPGALLVYERQELVLRLDTAGLTAHQEATVKRGIARRVREAQSSPW